MGIDVVMYADVAHGNFTKEQVIKLSYQLASTIGSENFFITRGDPERIGAPYDAISISEKEYKNKQRLNVNMYSRYYDESYARGNWPVIRSTIEWLWQNIESCQVYYGGDSDAGTELMTIKRVNELNKFFLNSGRKTYTRYKSAFAGKGMVPQCPCADEPMIDCGGGGKDAYYYCDGCGAKAITTADGKAIRLKRNENFFYGHERIRNE